MRARCDRTNKLMFVNEREALDELSRIIKRAMLGERRGRSHWDGDQSSLETGCFECQHCGHWHLTARPWAGSITSSA